jgi:hypothetical protein
MDGKRWGIVRVLDDRRCNVMCSSERSRIGGGEKFRKKSAYYYLAGSSTFPKVELY